jgi:hypothetical protein
MLKTSRFHSSLALAGLLIGLAIAITQVGGVVAQTAPAPNPPPTPFGEPGDKTPKAPTGDVVNAAKIALADVERAQSEVLKSFAELRRRLDQFNPAVPKAEKETLDAFKVHLDRMQLHGQRLRDLEPDFNAAVRRYDKALEKAPGEYRLASERYAKLAAEERYPDLKKDYADLAKAAQETAVDLEKRRGDLAVNAAKVTASLEWVGHALRLLDAMGHYLDLIPEPSRAAEIARFAASLERFEANFRTSVQSFRELHDRRLGAPSAPPPAPPLPSAPPAGPAREQPTTDSQYLDLYGDPAQV